jgi:hypothetical protein
MLYITYGGDEVQYHLHSNLSKQLSGIAMNAMKKGYANEIMIQADGHELMAIHGNFRNIPLPSRHNRVQRWYGNDALFILGNWPRN